MKILILHNRYKFHSGEENVVQAEASLLKERGHEVIRFELTNEGISGLGVFDKIRLPLSVIWSGRAYHRVREIIKNERPDIAHVHNTFFLMSPSVYYACRDERTPVVQTLHNFRFLCPVGLLYRDGGSCSECVDRRLLMSLMHRCGRKNLAWYGAMLPVLWFHYKKKTFKDTIDTYIAMSNFSKQQFIKAGFEEKKIKIKPNFIGKDPGIYHKKDNFAVYAGRISQEKGIDVMIEAWKRISSLPLKIIGNGVYLERFKKYAKEKLLLVEFLGQRSNMETLEYIKRSLFLILPSKCHENFPMVLVESFASGTPVIASESGALAEIIQDGKSGLLFEPGNSGDLTEKVNALIKDNDLIRQMGQNARKEYEDKYTVERNYRMLIDIYHDTITQYKLKG